MTNSIISLILITPIITAFVVGLLPSIKETLVKQLTLAGSLITFILSLILWIGFDTSTAQLQFVEIYTLLNDYNIHFILGVDGISILFIVLTTFLIPLCVLASWKSVTLYIKEYYICFLLLETLMLAVFCVADLILFYVFFESVLIPMFLIIGIWGARERKIHAAFQFFLYTLLGSVFMLLGILIIYSEVGTTNLQIIFTHTFAFEKQIILWLAFFASFAVKIPLVPVHIWLPEAHVEAPTSGSVILAGILLKLGAYGMLRISLPLFPEASIYFTPLVYAISAVGIIYTSLTTLRQIDLKKTIAYSSVAHMSFVTLGLFSFNVEATEGAILLMLSHGLVSGALFFCIGVLYERHHTRILKYYGGLAQTMPMFAIFFLIFTFSNLSLPGTSSFVGEFLILLGLFQSNTTICVVAAIGTILGAAYAIWLYNRVTFGIINIAYINPHKDLEYSEFIVFLPLVMLILLMGIYPSVFTDVIHISVANILSIYKNISI